jgi:saccharopine dehydrogenase-like NADP-dependent oxidoreductase
MPENILVIGAGRSATVLIDYLATHAPQYGWQLTIADASLDLAQEKIQPYPWARSIAFDVMQTDQRREAIEQADIVISLLPASFHPIVAKECLDLGKHLLTASYVSAEMKAMDADARAKKLLFLNEMGLDPGIDHLSAMQIIHRIGAQGGIITSFKSFCGGLIAPESDNNPWGYKFTWNPRNVVLAGQGTAVFLQNGQLEEIGYEKLFTRTETIQMEGYGLFEGYPNRDSLGYRAAYGLPDVQTMLRGTLRRPGYCEAWNVLVQAGLTDDQTIFPDSNQITLREFINQLVPGVGSLADRLAQRSGWPADHPAIQKVSWLGLDEEEMIGLDRATPAHVLQQVLEQKWRLQPDDRDLIVMQHQFEYQLEGKRHHLTSSLAVEGEDAVRTAMAKTVGLPLAIAARLLLLGKIPQRGVVIPVHKEIYEPVLEELQKLGVVFREKEE